MTTFIDRLLQEHAEVRDRTQELGKFLLAGGLRYDNLSPKQKTLLYMQHSHMSSYLQILEWRLADIQGDPNALAGTPSNVVMPRHFHDEPAALRLTGRTSQQIRIAPQGAIYVSHNKQAITIAQNLHRGDLGHRDVEWLISCSWVGTTTKIIIDHAVRLTKKEAEAVYNHNNRPRP